MFFNGKSLSLCINFVKVDFVALGAAIASILTAIGGWRFVSRLINKNTEKRKEEVRTRDLEMESLRKQVDWVQEKYEAVSKKLDDLYKRFRDLEEEKLQLIKEKHELELALKIAEYDRCERPDDDCIRRLPPRQKCRLKQLLNGTYEALDDDKEDKDARFEIHKVSNKGKQP